MATKTLPTEKDAPYQPGTIGDKVLEIVRSFSSGTGGEEKKDPVVPEIIKKMSDESPIGGGFRKKKIDKKLEESGG